MPGSFFLNEFYPNPSIEMLAEKFLKQLSPSFPQSPNHKKAFQISDELLNAFPYISINREF